MVTIGPEGIGRLGRGKITAFWATHAFLISMVFSNLWAFHKQNILLMTSGYTSGSCLSLLFLLGHKTPVHCHCTASCNDILPVIRRAMGGQGKGPSGTFSQDLRILSVLFWPNVALVGFFWCPQSQRFLKQAWCLCLVHLIFYQLQMVSYTIYLHILNCPVAQAEWNVPQEAT